MSGQFLEGNHKTFTNGNTARSQYVRVVLTAGVLELASATQREIGIATRRIEADVAGDVLLRTANGTVPMIAAGAIAAGAVVYTAASGKINDVQAAGAFRVGIALEAATADGDVIEILRDEVEAAAFVRGAHTVTAGEDTANTVDIVTGLDNITALFVQIYRSGVDINSNQAVSYSGGTITVANGATYVLTAGDVLHWLALG